MENSFRVRVSSFLSVLVCCIALVAPVESAALTPANTPPPESTSKVKRVLLYNKVGGWRTEAGIANVNQYMASLAQSKGFELDTLSDDAGITLEFLKQYQVMVWNNNRDGGSSAPSASARDAIVEYVNQGGGWFLIGLAVDHFSSWTAMVDIMGTSFSRWGALGRAYMQADSSALKHPELKFVVKDLPSQIGLTEYWMSYQRTVRPLRDVTVLYTTQGGEPNVLLPPEDGSGDRTYVWARTIEKGKLLFCPPGWAPESVQPSPIAQADSAVAKLYWNSMRWLAGDFQNGCTDPASPLFNPEARVDDGRCSPADLSVEARPGKRNGLRSPLQSRHASPSVMGKENQVKRDVQGRILKRFKTPSQN